MNINNTQTPATYVKAKQTAGGSAIKRKFNLKTLAIVLGLLIFVGGGISVFLISQKQNTTPVAPTAPQSQPAAYIEKTQTCTLEFEISEPDRISCGSVGCSSNDDCSDGLTCVAADNGSHYCSKEVYDDACIDDPNYDNCCTAPEDDLLACGTGGCSNSDDCSDGYVCVSTADTDDDGNIVKYCADEDYLDACVADPNYDNCCTAEDNVLYCADKGCDSDDDCSGSLICVEADDGNNYCSKEAYDDACIDDPDYDNCCTAPTVTPTTTTTVTATTTSTVTTVITTVGCNESCDANADCTNVSHICYNGSCRLDVNPTDEQCKLANGETTVVRAATVPTETGPADWMNYVKAGLGTLGVGALLLLLL